VPFTAVDPVLLAVFVTALRRRLCDYVTTGSPFKLKVSGPPDPTKVSVTGPGIRDGSFNTYQGVFYVNTKNAGRGELTVKMRGPKGK
jgi:hypothetical protein